MSTDPKIHMYAASSGELLEVLEERRTMIRVRVTEGVLLNNLSGQHVEPGDRLFYKDSPLFKREVYAQYVDGFQGTIRAPWRNN